MSEAERLSSIIGDIYDAALDPALWPAVLHKIAAFANGQAAGLLAKDTVSMAGTAYYHVGVDAHYLRLYQETYWKFDPLAPLAFYDVGEVTSRLDYIDDEEFRDGRFYREWAKPQGWIDSANVVLDKSPTTFAILSVIRDERSGPVDDEMRRRVALISPHVRRAVLIGKVIDLKSAEAATFADTLDGIAAGMFLVDAAGHIVHANAAGHAMLARGNVLHATGRRLVAGDAEADSAMREVFVAADQGDAAVGVGGIAIPLATGDGRRHVAHILPLTAGARRKAGAKYAAAAAVFVHKATLDAIAPPEAIAKTYRLTPTELRVLLAIVEVGGAPQVADALGIAESTVKTHLGRLYEKTGARRHADLVKLVAGFADPLARPSAQAPR